MEPFNTSRGIPPRTERYLVLKASQLSRRRAVWGMDRKDIAQELRIDLLRRLPAYDAEKATLETFCSRLIEHRISDLTTPTAASRAGRRAVSLDLTAENDGEDEDLAIGESLPESAGLFADEIFDVETKANLKLDVQAFLSTLPDDLRQCAVLLQSHSISDAARISGLNRSTIYARIERLRVAASDAGLRGYFGTSPTTQKPRP